MMFSKAIFPQEVKVTSDFGVWLGFDVEKKIFNGFDLNLEQQIRTFKNTSEIDDYLLDINLKYPINQEFSLGTSGGYIYNKKKVKERENNFRYSIEIAYKKKILQKIKVQYRLMYQKEYVNFYTNLYYKLDGMPYQNIYFSEVRNKMKISFKKNANNELYISSEIFRLSEIFREPHFNKVRFYLGDEIKTKIGEFDCSIGLEKELNSNNSYSFVFFKTIYVIKR